MALTVTATMAGKMPSAPFGGLALVIDCDTNYQSPGYDLDVPALLEAAGFQNGAILGVFVETKNAYTFWYNATAKKLEIYQALGTEVTNGTDLAAAGLTGVRAVVVTQ